LCLESRIIFLGVEAHAAERLEGVVRKHVDAAVVGFEIVDLLAEEESPEVFAEEFYYVEGGRWAGCVAGESGNYVSIYACDGEW
jgi:hypothetical protein